MNKKNKNTVINCINVVLVLVLIITLIASINCYITQYEKNYRTQELEASLQEAINNGEKLRIEYERRTNIREVEDYAVNVLGLQKYSNYQVEYITKQKVNKTVLFEKEAPSENVFSRVATVFSIIAEYFN